MSHGVYVYVLCFVLKCTRLPFITKYWQWRFYSRGVKFFLGGGGLAFGLCLSDMKGLKYVEMIIASPRPNENVERIREVEHKAPIPRRLGFIPQYGTTCKALNRRVLEEHVVSRQQVNYGDVQRSSLRLQNLTLNNLCGVGRIDISELK